MPPFTTTFVFPIGKTLGGANIWSARMCGYLQQAGLSTAAVMHTNPGWHPDGDLPIPHETQVLNCGGPPVIEAGLRQIKTFSDVYGKTLPAVVVPNWNDVSYAVCAELARTRADEIRVVGVAHGNNESYYGSLTYYESIIHVFIAVSDEIAGELKRRLPHRTQDILTRACPVEVPETWSRRPRDPLQPIVITYAGRITNHEKRVSDLTPLMSELDRQGVDFRFRIIGEGGYLPTLQWELQQLPENIRERVTVEGIYPPDAMPGIWQQSDICVLVSDSEGTSISMLEAMAAGCVPVVTRVSGTAAVIDEGRNGFTVPVGDLSALAGNIRRLANQADEWVAVSCAAFTTAQSRYAYPDYVAWFVDQINRLQSLDPRPWTRSRRVLPRQWHLPVWIKRIWKR